MSDFKPWIGVDLDGTLAEYDHWVSPSVIGAPIPEMVERVKGWLAEGKKVKLFTARASKQGDAAEFMPAWRKWSVEHLGEFLEVTCIKDWMMTELYDDRAVQIEKNTGKIVGYSTREEKPPIADVLANTLEADLLYFAWGIIANTSEGDWGKQPVEWMEAATRFRDEFHSYLGNSRG